MTVRQTRTTAFLPNVAPGAVALATVNTGEVLRL